MQVRSHQASPRTLVDTSRSLHTYTCLIMGTPAGRNLCLTSDPSLSTNFFRCGSVLTPIATSAAAAGMRTRMSPLGFEFGGKGVCFDGPVVSVLSCRGPSLSWHDPPTCPEVYPDSISPPCTRRTSHLQGRPGTYHGIMVYEVMEEMVGDDEGPSRPPPTKTSGIVGAGGSGGDCCAADSRIFVSERKRSEWVYAGRSSSIPCAVETSPSGPD